MRSLRRAAVAGMVAALGALGLSFGVAATTAVSAGAQTTSNAAGYPPPTGSTVVTNGASVTCAVGQTCTYSMGGFPPGASVTISVNGTPAAVVTADANGFVTFTVTVSDPHISINGGPAISVPAGANTISLSGGAVTQSFTLNVVSSTTPTTAATGAAGGSGGSSSTGSARSTGALAFTGADIAATVVGGLALLAVGTVLVVATRRRSSGARSES